MQVLPDADSKRRETAQGQGRLHGVALRLRITATLEVQPGADVPAY